MNIALVILHADAARGGAERYTLDLAVALAGRGHRVTLLASSFAEAPELVVTVSLPASGPTRLRRYVRFLDSLDAHLAETRYDVVHAMLPVRRCDVYHPHAGIAAESVAAGHRKHANSLSRAWARTANALNGRRQRFAAVERQLLDGPRPPVILCLSEYVKGTVRKHYDLPADRLATLFNAADTEKFDVEDRPEAGCLVRDRHGLCDDDTVALMIAQDFERKGLAEAIRALARVAHDVSGDRPPLRLLVVGKGNTRRYRAMSDRPGLRGRVVFAGPTADPYAYYRAADFFVLPTRHDPCSLVVLEALSMGLPVISTVFNGACEIMENGTHGFVLSDPSDVPALADAMSQLLDSERRRVMSDACLELRPKLAYERHLDELLRVYQSIHDRSAR